MSGLPGSPMSGAETRSPVPAAGGAEARAAAALSSVVMSSAPSEAAGGEAPGAAFAPDELAVVLSHYDLGVIEGVQSFRRGSRRSPKLLLKSERGVFLLKRRAEGRDDMARVAFAHGVQRHLAERGFPVARLAPTRRHGGTFVVHGGRVYELFSFVAGEKFNHSAPAAREAGRTLAWLHRLLAEVRPTVELSSVSYHNIAPVAGQVMALCQKLDPLELGAVGERLASAYTEAAARAEEQGFARWPSQIVHGDWHPGNVIFASASGGGGGVGVAAALDFDTARMEPRAVDIANGAMQFSITRNGDDPLAWPENLDEDRLREFIRGYDAQSPAGVVSRAEVAALPWLMIEAMIVEAIVPIAATGRFGPVGGVEFLRMVDRKVGWLQSNQSRLTALLS